MSTNESENLCENCSACSSELATLKQELSRLQKENATYTDIKRSIDMNRAGMGRNTSGVLVLYLNRRMLRYRMDIERFLRNLIDCDKVESGVDADAQMWASLVEPADGILASTQLCQGFILDSKGDSLSGEKGKVERKENESENDEPVSRKRPHPGDSEEKGCGDAPLASTRSFLDTMALEENKAPKPDTKRMRSVCFNCGNPDHQLGTCPEPKDYTKIAINRQTFLQESAWTNNRQRYTLNENDMDIGNDPRFSKFRPGHISEQLREALGTNSTQLPPFIYQMRCLGFPPGHLKEAELGFADVKALEGAAAGSSVPAGQMQYDIDKIWEYPGFNVTDLEWNYLH